MYRSFLIILFAASTIFIKGCSDAGNEERILNKVDYDYYNGIPEGVMCPAVMLDMFFDATSGYFSNNARMKRGSVTACGVLLFDHIEAPVSKNKTFLGWSRKYKGNVLEYTGSGETIYYAQWADTPPQPTAITFDANGGEFENGEKMLTVTTQSGSKFDFQDIPVGLKINDMHFAGWTKKKYNHFDKLSAAPRNSRYSALVVEPVTYYAVWVKMPPQKVTFIFRSNGGSFPDNTTSKTFVVTPGTRIEFKNIVSNPNHEKYNFIGWRGSSMFIFVSNRLSHSITEFKAQWDNEQIITNNIELALNGIKIFALDYITDNSTEKIILNGIISDPPGYSSLTIADSNNVDGYNIKTNDLYFDYFTFMPLLSSSKFITLADAPIRDFINFFKSDSFSKAERNITIDESDFAIEFTEKVLPFDIENSYLRIGARSDEFDAEDINTLYRQVLAKYPNAVAKQARNTKAVYVQKSDGNYIYWVPDGINVPHYFKILPPGTTTRLFLSKRTADKILAEFNK